MRALALKVVWRGLLLGIACCSLSATAWAQGNRVEEMLQRRTAALRNQLAILDAHIVKLKRRIPTAEQEIERLMRETKKIKAPNPDEETNAPPKRKSKEVAFRPPFERVVKKKTPIALVCQNNRVALLDFEQGGKNFTSLLDDEAKLKQFFENKSATVPAGDFQMKYTIHGVGEVLTSSKKLLWIPGRDGESMQNALRPGSSLLRRLKQLDAEGDLIQFVVYPDSFEVFRTVRQELWRRKFGVQWLPLSHGKEIILGSGRLTEQ